MKKISKKDLEKLPTHKDIVRFAIFCAEQVLHLTDKPEAKIAIETTRRWLVGEATSEECRVAAANAAAFAARAAAYAAVYTTAHATAATAATYAGYAATDATIDKQKIIEEQWNYYNELLYIDDILEEEVFCGS